MQTWQTIVDFVTAYTAREGSTPNVQLYRMLGNQALAIIADRVGPLETSWTNAVGGTLTLTGNSVVLPEGCLSVSHAMWNDDNLTRVDSAELDCEDAEWRTRTGVPYEYCMTGTTLTLDCIPSPAGTLTIYGNSTLGTFTETPGAVNPLTYLPEGSQIAPAYYILSMLPAEVRYTYKDGQIVGKDSAEVSRQQMFAAMWQAELERIHSAVNARKFKPYTGN
jgi:hypothetical protein